MLYRREDPLALLRQVLEPRERLIWAEHNFSPFPWAGWAALLLPLFTVVAMVEAGVLLALAPGDWPVWLMTALADLLLLVLVPLIHWRGKQRVYGLTDRRLLILRRFPHWRLQSYFPDAITGIECRESAAGLGDVIFRKHHRLIHDALVGDIVETVQVGFYDIPESARVAEAIKSLERESRIRGR